MNDADYYLDLIDRLLSTKDYDWCRETLEGIADTIERSERVTPKQKAAIDHIMAGRLKHDLG